MVHETLLDDVRHVLDSKEALEREVRDQRGTWLLLRVLPYEAKERVEGVVIALVDITNLKSTEEQLKRMSKVFMDGADPVIIEDLDGHIVDLNREAELTYGWGRDELLGKRIIVLVPEDRIQEAEEIRRHCRNRDIVRNVDTLRKKRSGEPCPILLTLSLLTGEDGEPAGIATIAKDISTLKAAQQDAQEAVKRRDEFLAMLSHELRNPLGAVLNATEVVDRCEGDVVSTRNALDVVGRQTRQMARLLDDLLDVSRVAQGRIDIRPQVVDLTQLVREAIQVVQPEMDRRQHTLEVEIGQQPVWVDGDPSRLLQIQQNLLTNAAKYTPPGGQIEVALTTDDKSAIITVKDNGHGIAPAMLSSIFDLFVQGDESLDRSNGGMGVGLNLVKMLVEIHGGSVSVHSDGPDCGSKFTVSLPLSSDRPPDETPSEEYGETYNRVLVIEDNDDSRQMLEELLRMDGYDVTVASDGLSGVEAIEACHPEVALVDIGLPELDGYQVAERVRSRLSDKSVKLVALTGYGRQADHRAVMEAGFDEHLVKPVSPEDLSRVLRRPK